MATPQQMQSQLKKAKQVLSDRLFETEDANEVEKIKQEINNLDSKIDRFTLDSLNAAAQEVADAAEGLMAVVRSARTGPLDGYLAKIQPMLGRLRVQIEEAMNKETGVGRDLPKTEDIEIDKPLPTPELTPAPAVEPPEAAEQRPQIIKSAKFEVLKDEYQSDWNACRIKNDRRRIIESHYVLGLNQKKEKYEGVSNQFQGMPWYFIGIIHGMESGFNFDTHLHNGDPLAKRTVRVPKGRPLSGNPPFSWEESARDAMVEMGYDQVTDWSLPHILYLWEKYNGFGYRFKLLRTPYLWSYSNLYTKGRYVADGVFDPNKISGQCGAASMLKLLGVV
jgi:lysozyme family protein